MACSIIYVVSVSMWMCPVTLGYMQVLFVCVCVCVCMRVCVRARVYSKGCESAHSLMSRRRGSAGTLRFPQGARLTLPLHVWNGWREILCWNKHTLMHNYDCCQLTKLHLDLVITMRRKTEEKNCQFSFSICLFISFYKFVLSLFQFFFYFSFHSLWITRY